MNIAKKISARANCRYGEPPVTVKKKVPSNAIAPTTAHTAVTTLEVRLANTRALPFYGGLRGDLTDGLITCTVRRFTAQRVSGPRRGGQTASECRIVAPSAPPYLALIHRSAWKGRSPKSMSTILHSLGH